MSEFTEAGPHQGRKVSTAGKSLSDARAVMVLLHGRGADGDDILALAAEFNNPHYAYLAPNAAGNTWYPSGFMSPIAHNEPGISSGLKVIDDLLQDLESNGFPAEKVFLAGFSQGACLTLEYAARYARRFAGVAAFSGGLIGPDNTPRDYPGSLENTPVFLGCSDIDFHIPLARVEHSAEILSKIGGNVTKRIYQGMGHTINRDEIQFVSAMMGDLVNS